jgi:membrane protein YqaA with SNARE-associated domain
VKTFAAKLEQFLAAYGAWGILATSFLDSTFVPMPGFNDLLLLHLSSRRPALALVYALQCTLGSLLGCYVVYSLGRGGRNLFRRSRAGKPGAEGVAAAAPRSSSDKTGTAERWLQRNDFVSVLVMSLLPPPAPFKVFVFTAGALRVNRLRFGAALVIGRGFRFVAEAWLGARYGTQAEAYIQHHVGRVSLVLAVAVTLGTLIYRRLQKATPGGPPLRG